MEHEQYMKRCLWLAANAQGKTSPNPLVGSVVVYQNQIIGEGWHHKAGEAHAEVNAIASVNNHDLLPDSTLYVNLEPCAHYGKTPPCSDLIIEKKIRRVVIGSRDPFSEVNGRGIERLQRAGVEVIVNVMQSDCEFLNRRFFTYHRKKRPYIILKWAQSRDGFMDRDRTSGEQGINWITQPATKSLVHLWRSQEDAIVVGAQTVINDNPSLTVREVAGKSPIRIVLNPDKHIDPSSAVFDGSVESLYFSASTEAELPGVTQVPLQPGEDVPDRLLSEAYKRGIQSLFIEGGAYLLNSLLERELWDEARVLTGNTLFHSGLKAPEIKHTPGETEGFGADQVHIYYS